MHSSKPSALQSPNRMGNPSMVSFAPFSNHITNDPSSNLTSQCLFNDCSNEVSTGQWKCKFHRNRSQCSFKNCYNQVYARRLCVRHGGKKKCAIKTCNQNARGGLFCSEHGGVTTKRYCIEPGCTKQAHGKKLCVRHGGGRKCKFEHCQHHARTGGLCNRHSEGRVCKEDNCARKAHFNVEYCYYHIFEHRPAKKVVGKIKSEDPHGDLQIAASPDERKVAIKIEDHDRHGVIQEKSNNSVGYFDINNISPVPLEIQTGERGPGYKDSMYSPIEMKSAYVSNILSSDNLYRRNWGNSESLKHQNHPIGDHGSYQRRFIHPLSLHNLSLQTTVHQQSSNNNSSYQAVESYRLFNNGAKNTQHGNVVNSPRENSHNIMPTQFRSLRDNPMTSSAIESLQPNFGCASSYIPIECGNEKVQTGSIACNDKNHSTPMNSGVYFHDDSALSLSISQCKDLGELFDQNY